MLHRWNFQQKREQRIRNEGLRFGHREAFSHIFFFFFPPWLLQTSWQPELSKHLCYTESILILGLMPQTRSKPETEVTICFFAVSSGYKKLGTMTSRLARHKTDGGSLSACKHAAKESENGELRLSSRCDRGRWALTTLLLQNHLLHRVFSNSRFWPNSKSEHWILLKKHEKPAWLYKFQN